mgnify:CR=1 FL=1
MATAAVGDAIFDGVFGDDFVEYGLLALTAAQNASAALAVLAAGAAAARSRTRPEATERARVRSRASSAASRRSAPGACWPRALESAAGSPPPRVSPRVVATRKSGIDPPLRG